MTRIYGPRSRILEAGQNIAFISTTTLQSKFINDRNVVKLFAPLYGLKHHDNTMFYVDVIFNRLTHQHNKLTSHKPVGGSMVHLFEFPFYHNSNGKYTISMQIKSTKLSI